MKRVPALIVSGFLGSGKTTLVRRLLEAAQAEGARVAFVSNELGALGIDAALLGVGSDTFVELAGGCVCCALNDALYDTLIALREQVDPDRIVIETSGVAIPHDVQITFYQPPIRDWISEEAVVTVVNAEQVSEGRDLEGTFAEQIESADLVVLNKVDLVSAHDVSALKGRVAAMNPGVPIVSAVRGDVDTRLLFSDLGRDPAHRDAVAHGQHTGHDHHHEDFEARPITLAPGLDVAGIDAFLRGQGALRAKGFVDIDGVVHVVQGVGRRLEITPAEIEVDPALLGRVVVIRRL